MEFFSFCYLRQIVVVVSLFNHLAFQSAILGNGLQHREVDVEPVERLAFHLAILHLIVYLAVILVVKVKIATKNR